MEEKKPTISIEPDKLKLEREITEKEKLRIFFMFVKRDNVVPTNEQIGAFIAYRPEDALKKAMQDYPARNIFYQGQNIVVEDFIRQVYLLDKIEIKADEPLPPAEQKRLSRDQFVWNLSLVADEFIKDPQDQEQLKKIIGRIK